MNILIIRFSSLGDIVLTAGVVESLRRRYPDARMTFLTKNQYVPVFDSDSRIYRVVGIDGIETPPEIRDLLGENTYDVVIDLHANLRSLFVVSLLKSPMKLRIQKHAFARRMMIWSRNMYRRRFDTLGQYHSTLSPLGITEQNLPVIIPDQSAVGKAKELLAAIREPNNRRIIGIAPGAKHATKRWNEISFARLAESLIDSGYSVVFIGDSKDTEIVGRIQTTMTHNTQSFAGTFDIRDAIGLISQLDFLVCNDSGPMHLAGALGIPFAALFGPTHPDLGFCPGYPNGHIIHTGLKCSPCSIHGSSPCRMKKRECMDNITPEQVMKIVHCLVDGSATAER